MARVGEEGRLLSLEGPTAVGMRLQVRARGGGGGRRTAAAGCVATDGADVAQPCGVGCVAGVWCRTRVRGRGRQAAAPHTRALPRMLPFFMLS